jgi:hypothetical protein
MIANYENCTLCNFLQFLGALNLFYSQVSYKKVNIQITVCIFLCFGPGSSICIVTRPGLDGLGSYPGGGARFSAPVRTGPAADSASYTMDTASFPEKQQPGRGVNHPHPI